MINLTKPNKNEEETCTFSSFCSCNVDSDRCMGTIPQITDEAKANYTKMMTEERKRSDEAWEKALPIVLKEAKEGRPYISYGLVVPMSCHKLEFPRFRVLKEVECIVLVVRGGKVITVY